MAIITPSYADRYGYYQIGNTKTYSKFELMDLHYKYPQAWRWKYNDELFGSYNWMQEPPESINELYRQRAQQLRETYDYIILYYSGGHDSANMLYAFLENNIKIDEICVFYSRLDNVSNQNEEFQAFTKSKIKFLKEKYPELKIRMLDYSDHFFNWDSQIKQSGYGYNLLEMFGDMLSINRLVIDNFHILIEDWKKLIEAGKKVSWVRGTDKPSIRYFNGDWIFNFRDGQIDRSVTPYKRIIDDGNMGTAEFFYWSPSHECAKIIIKQCHLLKKRYDHQAKINFSSIPGSKPFKPGYGWEIDTMHSEFIKTIYPRLFTFTEQFYTKKTLYWLFGNRDKWFFESNHEKVTLHRNMYDAMTGSNYSHLRPWYNDRANLLSGVQDCISPNYKF